MTLYAESSAVLSWLHGEKQGTSIRALLGKAAAILASDLTLIECDRVLIRAVTLKVMSEKQAVQRRSRLMAAAAHWNILRVTPEIVDRARRRFPIEPIRTLDALHLSSAMLASSAIDDFALLTLDDRIRNNAAELGLSVLPK